MSDAVTLTRKGPLLELVLNRPERRNAFDEAMIHELRAAIDSAATSDARALVLSGRGPAFCAGGDLEWMRSKGQADMATNRADAAALADLLLALWQAPLPTIALTHGNVFGGGVGLTAACDIALATADTTFCLSEARLGLVAAVISPYVMMAIGMRQTQRLMLTAEYFDAHQAQALGLVHYVAARDGMEQVLRDHVLHRLLKGAPGAQRTGKYLLRQLAGRLPGPAIAAETATTLATARASAEAREGIDAFLAQRRANWIPE